MPSIKWAGRISLVCVLLLMGGCLMAAKRQRIVQRVHAIYHQLKAAHQQNALKGELPPAERADNPLVIYSDDLGDGWQDWSWATHNLKSADPVHTGTRALVMTPTENKGVYFHHDGFDTAGYGALAFYVHGASRLNICLADGDNKFLRYVPLRRYVKGPNFWVSVVIPLADLGVTGPGQIITGVVFQADGLTPQAPLAIDDIALLPDTSLPAAPTHLTVSVTIDAQSSLHPISPLVYGMAFAPASYVRDLRLGINRWGGNDKSRYNWVLGNADNAARDWEWRNRKAVDSDLNAAPSSAADGFITDNKAGGAQTLLTIPTLGWVARDAVNDTRSLDVPAGGGDPLRGPAGPIAGYDPARNRSETSVASYARKGAPFTAVPFADGGPVFQDEWVSHLVRHFGEAAHGGVRYYAMDNEPDLWDSTHTDVHPARMGYDDILHTFLEYATAVKAVDPNALVTGPVSWGWTGYQYSALDKGDDNFHSHPDQNRHGGQWLVPWFLAQVRAHDKKTGQRSLDVLDLHFYPQGSGLYGGQSDKDANARRLRSVRALYDPSYVDESWINTPIRLIPRMKEWVAQNYPGTKLALTEWNFGADSTMNGGLAAADALGVFGREQLDMACYWAYPPPGSPAYLAFQLYRNADGAGHGFGDVSCHAVSARPDALSVYSSLDTAQNVLTIILLNKSTKATETVPISLSHWVPKSDIQSWRVSAENGGVTSHASLRALPDTAWTGVLHTVTLPPYSMTLLRVPTVH